jgi:hypothetical protein
MAPLISRGAKREISMNVVCPGAKSPSFIVRFAVFLCLVNPSNSFRRFASAVLECVTLLPSSSVGFVVGSCYSFTLSPLFRLLTVGAATHVCS